MISNCSYFSCSQMSLNESHKIPCVSIICIFMTSLKVWIVHQTSIWNTPWQNNLNLLTLAHQLLIPSLVLCMRNIPKTIGDDACFINELDIVLFAFLSCLQCFDAYLNKKKGLSLCSFSSRRVSPNIEWGYMSYAYILRCAIWMWPMAQAHDTHIAQGLWYHNTCIYLGF